MKEPKLLGRTIKNIYKPRFIALNLFLGAAYYAAFLYLAYLQGGNALMVLLPAYLLFLLIATSSILMTVVVYSIMNKRRGTAKVSGTAASAGTVVLGSGLCGCTTTLLPTIALAVGVSTPGVYALTSFLRNYNVYITSVLIVVNAIVLLFYINKLSKYNNKYRPKSLD